MSQVTMTISCFLCAGICLTLEIQKDCGPTVREFKAKVKEDPEVQKKIAALREEVENFAVQFPMPGFDMW